MNRKRRDAAGDAAQAACGPVLGRGYSRRDWQALAAVLLLALVLRGVLCSRLACVSRDGVHFISFAKQLADDPISTMKTTTKQPGFSWLLLGIHGVAALFIDADSPIAWQRCGQVIALVGGLGVCGLVFVLTRHWFDTTTASVAGVLAAVWPQGAHLSADVLSDTPHLALYLFAIFLAYRAMKCDRLGWLVPCGAVAGLAYLLRQEALGAVVGAAICWAWPDRRRSWLRQVAGVAALALCFAVVIAPHSIATGRLLPNKSPWELLLGPHEAKVTTETRRHGEEKDEGGRMKDENGWGCNETPAVASSRPIWRAEPALPGLILHPSSFALPSVSPRRSRPATAGGDLFAEMIPWWKAPAKMAEAWAKSGRYVISTLFLLALVLKSSLRAEPTGRRLVAVVVLLQLLAVQFRIKSYGEISSRYMIIPLALSIPWAASGLLALLNIIATRLRTAWNVQSIDVRTLGTVLIALPMLYDLARPVNYDKTQYRQAGEWLYQHARPDDLVLAQERLEQLMFYAGRTYPDRTWVTCTGCDSIEGIRAEIARGRPQWFADAAGSRRGKIDEARLFRELSSGVIPKLQSAWSGGASGHDAYVFRVAPQAWQPAPAN